ncbi:MmcB family DNA repair protein [Alkalicoccus chagannorensis]|uniref:MmcB family DNA repair protein n=1 Tax=Alkalicoccus chagannorensis TaxID=427072 RepID=UPI0004031B26|nr:MmcB family DNA repair protein [Alkalicoccus chagannorensis]
MEQHQHQFLKMQALHWLKHKMTDLCAVEVKYSCRRKKRTADAVGISFRRREARIIEVKTSRQDYFRDDVIASPSGYAAVADYAYILTPAGMLKKEELPAGYGVMEADEYGKITIVKNPTRNKKPALKLDTLVRRTSRAATNAHLFQEENKLSKGHQETAYSRSPVIQMIRATCPSCRKRHPYVIHPGQNTVRCRGKSCKTEVELARARMTIVSQYNGTFIKEMNAIYGDISEED